MTTTARRLAVLAVLGAGAVVVWRYGAPDTDWVQGRGRLGVLVFVFAYAAAALLPVPKAVFSLAGGAIFGVPLGLAATLAGATLGAAVAFGAARVLGRDVVRRRGGRSVDRLDATFTRHGLVAVIGLRLVPVVPFTALNYAAGLTALRWRDYLAGTVLGMTPGAAAYTILGAYGREPGSWPFLAAVVSLGLLTVSGLVLARAQRRRHGGASAATPPAPE